MSIMRYVYFSVLWLAVWSVGHAETLRVATYNLRNYLITDRVTDHGWRPDYPKPEAEKAALRKAILQVNPDVILLQELGPEPFVKELQGDLALEGLGYTFAFVGVGNDPVRHLGILSKREPVEVHLHRDMDFKYFDARLPVKRGLLEVVFEDADGGIFKLFGVHLKSRWSDVDADPGAELRRTREAEAYRNRVIERTYDLGVTRFLIAGDFNDQPGSATFRRFEKRGHLEIASRVTAEDSRREVWTHYYEKLGAYTLVDAFFLSPSWLPAVQNAAIYDGDLGMVGSDHRLVYLDLVFE